MSQKQKTEGKTPDVVQIYKKLRQRWQEKKTGEMSVVGHLTELRNRIAVSVVVLIAAFMICFAFIKPFVQTLLDIGLQSGFEFVYIEPSELLMANFKLALVMALVIVSPVLVFQIWGFVAPALTKHQKRAVYPILLGGFFFFSLGVAFCYFIAVPFMLQFLVKYSQSEWITSSVSVASYLDFMMGMFLTFGLIFEEPMLALILTEVGIITPAMLKKVRSYAIPLIFVLGAIITPPDVVSQIMVALPMIGLYDLSIYISKLAKKHREKRLSDEEAEDTELQQ